MSAFSLLAAKVLASSFLAVLFLQSGLDKVLDWKGNRAYVGDFLSKTPLRPLAGFLFLVITVGEVLAGVLCAAGVAVLVLTQSSGIALAGAVVSSLNILSLFLGQRLAKDYAAAAGMVPYALFAIGSVLVQGH